MGKAQHFMSLEAAKIQEDFGETALTTLRNTYFKPFYLPTHFSRRRPEMEIGRALAKGPPAVSPFKLVSSSEGLSHSSLYSSLYQATGTK